MREINIFCFGFGQVARDFIKKLSVENFNINLVTTSRNETSEKKLEQINYTSYQLNDNFFDPEIKNRLKETDFILVSIPPSNGTDLVFKEFAKIIECSKVKWITYLSATSVYGDHKSKWVNENSHTKPSSKNGSDRLIAENLWMSLYIKKKIPLQIFRLSGIYSNKKNILTRLKSEDVKIINKKNNFFSRIHIDDISNVLFESLSKFKSGEIFNISDDEPASLKDVTLYGTKLLKLKTPNSIEIRDLENSMLKNFYKDSKKVSNKKMKNFFKYKLKFPTYKEGLDYIFNNFI